MSDARSAWQCLYLIPIDTADFPTIQRVMLKMHEIASTAPSHAVVLVLINYMHLDVLEHIDEEETKKRGQPSS